MTEGRTDWKKYSCTVANWFKEGELLVEFDPVAAIECIQGNQFCHSHWIGNIIQN